MHPKPEQMGLRVFSFAPQFTRLAVRSKGTSSTRSDSTLPKLDFELYINITCQTILVCVASLDSLLQRQRRGLVLASVHDIMTAKKTDKLCGRRLYYTINAGMSYFPILWSFSHVFNLSGRVGILLVSTHVSEIRPFTNFRRSSFGYDQGVMGGVNTSPDYVRVMRLGHSE